MASKGRPNQGKSATTIARSIKITMPSFERLKQWKAEAKEAGTTMSRHILEMAEKGRDADLDLDSRERLAERIKLLDGQAEASEARIETLELLTKRQEEELLEYRTRDFTDSEFDGQRVFDTRLVKMLREQEFVHSEDLYDLLGVDARTDPRRIEAIQSQLDIMGTYGMVENTTRGWRWIG